MVKTNHASDLRSSQQNRLARHRLGKAHYQGKPVPSSPAALQVHFPAARTSQRRSLALSPSRTTADTASPESPVKGPLTPVSGQLRQQRFADAAQQPTARSPALPPPPPPNVNGRTDGNDQQLARPTYSSHYASNAAPNHQSLLGPPPRPAAAYPGPATAQVPGRAAFGTPFNNLPLDHQNFILKTATHCWKDQYAALQQQNKSLRASLESDKEQHKVMNDRVQLLEQQLRAQTVKLEPVA